MDRIRWIAFSLALIAGVSAFAYPKHNKVGPGPLTEPTPLCPHAPCTK